MIVNHNRIEKNLTLTEAIQKRRFGEIEKILRSGVDANTFNKRGELPLHVAIRVGEIRSVALLLQIGGVDPLKSKKGGETAFHLASFCGRIDMLKLLQQYATSSDWVKKRDKVGRRPIDCAKGGTTCHWLKSQMSGSSSSSNKKRQIQLLKPLIASKLKPRMISKVAYLAMSSEAQPVMALRRVKRQRGAVEVSPGEEFLTQSGVKHRVIAHAAAKKS